MAVAKDQKYRALNDALAIAKEHAGSANSSSGSIAASLEKSYNKTIEIIEKIEKED